MMNDGLTRRSLLQGVVAGYLVSNARVRAQSSDPTSLTIDQARALIASRKLSPVEMTRAYLARIEKINSGINAYITVTGESALTQAQALEAEMAKGAPSTTTRPLARTTDSMNDVERQAGRVRR